MSLKGKVGVVTSSTSGIGLGIARAFAGAGADIFINGFGERDVIEGIRRKVADEYKVRVAYSGADMSKAPEIAAMIAQATKELGGVDILVNNAGIQHTAPVRDFPAEQWEAIIAINLFAAFYPTQAALPYMLERNWGRVINIASRHGLVASAQKSAYVAAKHGIVGFTKVVALETATTGVTCNAICPGWVLTRWCRSRSMCVPQKKGSKWRRPSLSSSPRSSPPMNFVTPEQLGSCAVFLCSEGAAQFREQECDRWGMDSTVERFCEVAMRNKITSAAEAVAIVQNGDAVCSSGFVGIGVPDALLVALEKRFVEAGEPRDLTLLFAAGQGDGKSAASMRSAMRGY